MQLILRLLALLIVLVLLAVAFARADGGYTQLLSQYDRNGNGLLEAHERAAMLTATQDHEPLALSAFPLVCEGEPASAVESAAGESASAGGAVVGAAAGHVRIQRDQLAVNPPQDDVPPAEDDAAAANGYTPQAPTPQPPVMRVASAVQYRTLLRETPPQPRSQPFAQAATFGPMIGRTKQYPRRYFAATAHVGCACSRASLYLAGY